jgi:hypothetical protein
MPNILNVLVTVLCVVAMSCRGEGTESKGYVLTVDRAPVPPVMAKRDIGPPTDPVSGKTFKFEEGGSHFTLFIPDAWTRAKDVHLTLHFHGAEWFAIQEHQRRGLVEPLVAFYPGEGSTIYRKNFEDPKRLSRLLTRIEDELKQQGAPADARIVHIDITSFSAGYGAVREIVKQPEYVRLIRRIILADSMYADWGPTTRPGDARQPASENIDPWIPFARLAATRGSGKTFVLTHSNVPTSYANTAACAEVIKKAVGIATMATPKGSLPATLDADYPLISRADLYGFHIWSYGGTDAGAHMTHARHVADVWLALNAAEKR